MKNFLLIASVFIMSFLVGYWALGVWEGPTGTAPANNAPAPINVSTTAQSKNAALTFSNFFDYEDNAYYVNPASTGTAALFKGNVGIGTTGPGKILTVFRSSDASINLIGNNAGIELWKDSTPSKAGRITYDVIGNKLILGSFNGTSWTSPFVIEDGTPSNTLYLKSDGNVGIGTTGPGAAKLNISGTTTGATQYGLYLDTTLDGTTQNFGGRIIPLQTSIASSNFYGWDVRPRFEATSGGPQAVIYGVLGIPIITANASANVTSAIAGYFRVDNASTAGSVLTNAYGLYVVAPTVTGTITNKYALVTAADAGNVGIGTTGPGTKLHVRVDGDGANAVLRLSSILTNWNAGYGPRLLFHGGADDRVFGEIGSFLETTGTGGHAYMTFSTRRDEVLGERMRITSAGNVGIGTTSPGQKLTVAGTIETTTGGVKFPDGTTQGTADKCVLRWAMFQTSSTYTGDLGGVEGANAKCNSDANKPSGYTAYFALHAKWIDMNRTVVDWGGAAVEGQISHVGVQGFTDGCTNTDALCANWTSSTGTGCIDNGSDPNYLYTVGSYAKYVSGFGTGYSNTCASALPLRCVAYRCY